MQLLDLVEPLGRPVLERARRWIDRDARHQRREVLGRERRRVRQAGGERDDLGPRGDGHHVAHRRGGHPARALREQPAVALDLVRAGRRVPLAGCRLSSCDRERTSQRAWTISSTSYRALGIAAAIGIRPLPAHAPRRRARARRTSGSTSTAPTSLSWSRLAVPARDRRRGRRLRDRRPPPRADAYRTGRLPAARDLARARRAAGGRLDRRPQLRLGPGVIVGVACRRARVLRGRSSLFDPRQRRRLDAEAASALPLYAEGAALASRGRLGAASRRWRCSWSAALAWLLIGGRRRQGEKYAGCGSSGEEARPRRHRRDEARDARAGGRDGPRADAGAADGARAATSTTAWRRSRRSRPVCAASIATGTGPDEHEIPAMNWWHRGEERYIEYGTSFGAVAARSASASRSPTRSTT